MQKCKYLEDIGLAITEYGTNFMSDDDKRSKDWALERTLYGFDNRETWNLNIIFIEWLYTRVLMYKEQASKRIDLSFHKIQYHNEILSQIEVIDRILSLSKEILLDQKQDELLFIEKSYEICELWKEVLPYMWW